MKSETDFKVWMVNSVKSVGGYARRVEDQYAVGILDCMFILDGVAVFAEVKLVRGTFFEPTPRQFVELERIKNAGGNAILIGCKEHPREDIISFAPVAKRAYIDDKTTQHYSTLGYQFPYMLRHYMEMRHNVR